MLFSITFVIVIILLIVTSRILINNFANEKLNNAIFNTKELMLTQLDEDNLIETLKEIMPRAEISTPIYIRVEDEEGSLLADSKHFDFKIIEGKSVFKPIYSSKLKAHVVYDIFSIETKTKGILYVTLVYNFMGTILFYKNISYILVLINIIGFIIIAITSYVISNKTLKPLVDIAELSKSASLEDLSIRLPVDDTENEVSILAKSINSLIERTQEMVEYQTQFVADASHELKTPITAILGYGNLIQRWGKEDADVLDKAVSSIITEAKSMEELIEKLLLLSKYDNEILKLQQSVYCINDIVTEAISTEKFAHRKISTSRTDTAFIKCDYRLIKQLLIILLDNSIIYTDPEGRVDLSIIKNKNKVDIVVSDTGIGIAESEIPYLFNRFYRSEKSRAKIKGGNGLGLSIAKKITEIHNGIIKIDSRVGIGTSVIVTFMANDET